MLFALFLPVLKQHIRHARILNDHHRCAILKLIGEWRSLVAHLHGVQGAAGSNPVSPTKVLHDVFDDVHKYIDFIVERFY